MNYDVVELAPGEVAADRYEPADEQLQQAATSTADELAEWEAKPWF